MHVDVTFDREGSYTIKRDGAAIAPGPGPLPSPVVLFLGSLAACSGLFAFEYLKTRKLPFEGLKVTAEADHAEGPRRLADVRIRVILPAPVAERHLAPLHRAVDLCTLKGTLTHPPSVLAEVGPGDEAATEPSPGVPPTPAV